MDKDEIAGLVEALDAVGTRGNPVEFYGLAGQVKDALTTLSAERDDLKRRLDNICMDIHTCNGDDCERPVCVERRKNAILSARVEALEAEIRRYVGVHGVLTQDDRIRLKTVLTGGNNG